MKHEYVRYVIISSLNYELHYYQRLLETTHILRSNEHLLHIYEHTYETRKRSLRHG